MQRHRGEHEAFDSAGLIGCFGERSTSIVPPLLLDSPALVTDRFADESGDGLARGKQGFADAVKIRLPDPQRQLRQSVLGGYERTLLRETRVCIYIRGLI